MNINEQNGRSFITTSDRTNNPKRVKVTYNVKAISDEGYRGRAYRVNALGIFNFLIKSVKALFKQTFFP